MLKITKISENRVDIDLSGKLDGDAMRQGLDDLISSSEDVKHGRMCYRITDFSLPTIEAIGVEMARLPKLFKLLSIYDKCAVMTDSDWLRKAAELEGSLFPNIEIRSFGLEEQVAADAWLAVP